MSLSSVPHPVAPGKISVLADKPYSASMFASGSVIEFFDRVVLLREQQITVLENQPAVSVRTFPTSRRYKRLICVTQEEGVALHAIFPSDKEAKIDSDG